MAIKIDWWAVLDFFCWGIDTLGRPSISRALRGYDDERHDSAGKWFFFRLESEGLATRRGRGANAQFTITEKGRQRCAEFDPRPSWNGPWDRQWRIVSYDVPELRRKDRLALWRELRARKLGYLQRSVWIWPHRMEAILEEVIQASGVPECFAGFECGRLFLCTDEEIVRTAWDFEGIQRSQAVYVKKSGAFRNAIRTAADLGALVRAAHEERLAYHAAMENDPFLPRVLWPKGYLGLKVQELHEEARAELTRRMPSMVKS
jgi:DNA-binding transcriptional regulator PaaX